jgi:hypothetical protein
MRWTRTAVVILASALLGVATVVAQNTATTPSRTPHRALGKDDCLACHAAGANAHVASVPANHHYPNTMCARCHRPAETMPTRSQHPLDAAHTRCAVCHVQGNTLHAQPIPATHTRYHASTCAMCHEPQSPS